VKTHFFDRNEKEKPVNFSEEQKERLMFKLTNSLTNYQKYYVMIAIIGTAFFLLIYGIVSTTASEINLINAEMSSQELIAPLRRLYENVIQHQLLVRRYHNGDKGTRVQIRKLQSKISQDMRQVKLNEEALEETVAFQRGFISEQNDTFHVSNIVSEWEGIASNTFDLPPAKLEETHSSLERKINAMIEQLSYAANPNFTLTSASFYLNEANTYEMPVLLKTLVQEQSEEGLQEESTSRLLTHYFAVKFNVESAIAELAKSGEYPALQKELSQAFSLYESKMDRSFQLIENPALLEEAGSTKSLQKEAFEAGSAFWEKSKKVQDNILQLRLSEIFPGKYIILAISLVIAIFGFLMGRFFVRKVLTSVENLDSGFKSLQKGNFKVRVPVNFADEIGRTSVGFNLMATKLEALFNQLHRMFDATKKLAGGDFSTRVSIDEKDDDEIRQVSVSFNRMAETFEQIIAKLKRLGVDLKDSADDISAATKNHEESTTDQKSTIDDILAISNEISNNAEEFSKTIREINDSVEQTTQLASEGQGSLNAMESIMREMVDSSSDIASKLGILNDKAGNINTVIVTITKVADQTNLLSLNAAIEAHKADEYGRSFSVIAGVIRELADQTAMATLDIGQIVDEIMSAVTSCVMGVDDFSQEIRNGVEQVERVGEQLSKIIEQVQVLADRFESVNEGMDTQKTAARQINFAITKLSDTAQVTAESMHQFRITTEQLFDSANSLERETEKLLPESKITE